MCRWTNCTHISYVCAFYCCVIALLFHVICLSRRAACRMCFIFLLFKTHFRQMSLCFTKRTNYVFVLTCICQMWFVSATVAIRFLRTRAGFVHTLIWLPTFTFRLVHRMHFLFRWATFDLGSTFPGQFHADCNVPSLLQRQRSLF